MRSESGVEARLAAAAAFGQLDTTAERNGCDHGVKTALPSGRYSTETARTGQPAPSLV
jgi:hypothetical protein